MMKLHTNLIQGCKVACQSIARHYVNGANNHSAIQIRFASSMSSCKLAIFDKDGTLTCFDSMWAGWCEDTARRFVKATSLDVAADVYDVLKFDPKSRVIGKGGMSEKTHFTLEREMIDLLVTKYQLQQKHARFIVNENWFHSFECEDLDVNQQIRPLGDVRGLFQTLTSNGVKIAVCTADSRVGTELSLKTLGVESFVDRLLCGDDSDNVPKPAPENIWLICKELGVTAKDAAIIGDTPADMMMGLHSGVGATIGVLTGVCKAEELHAAHYVVDSIDDTTDILLN